VTVHEPGHGTNWPVRPTRVVARFRRGSRLAWRAAGRGVIGFYNSSNLTYASSIAYYALLSIFPFVLLFLSLLGKVSVGPSAESLGQVVANALPSHFDFLVDRIDELATTPLQLSLAGTLVAIWASMGVFGAVTSAVNHAWGVGEPIGFFKHKLMSFLMLMAAGLLLVATLMLVAAIRVVEASWFASVLSYVPALQALTGLVYRNATTPMFILVVGLIYYFVPNAQVRLRDVWVGAVLAGLLWRAAFAGFAWYVRDFSRFSLQGSVGAVIVFLIWIYLSAVILLYGVEVTAAYARLRKRLPQQGPAAPAREA
jgi:membrane protein